MSAKSRKAQTRSRKHSPRRVRRYDFKRWRPGSALQPAADLYGRSLSGTTFRRNGKLEHSADCEQNPSCEDTRERSMLSELRRRVSKEIAKCRMSGLCTDTDLQIIEAMVAGVSLRGMAALLKMKHQGIAYRIRRFDHRAPFFWRLWQHRVRFMQSHESIGADYSDSGAGCTTQLIDSALCRSP
jgi:hypothetical protein